MVLRWTQLLVVCMPDCDSEQDAARALGFTQRSWDNESGRERQPASEDKAWLQLTQRERRAATRLGYNQRLWDWLEPAQQPASAGKGWSELSNLERRGAMGLGYNQRNWDNESGSERQPSTGDLDWDYLTSNQQNAARELGYSRRSWDGPRPDSVYRAWSELSSCGEKCSHIFVIF